MLGSENNEQIIVKRNQLTFKMASFGSGHEKINTDIWKRIKLLNFALMWKGIIIKNAIWVRNQQILKYESKQIIN